LSITVGANARLFYALKSYYLVLQHTCVGVGVTSFNVVSKQYIVVYTYINYQLDTLIIIYS